MTTTTIPNELLIFLRSIASESRINILLLFMDGQPRTVNQITEAIGLGQSTISEHLALMKKSGLLISQKTGKEVYYQPDRAKIILYVEMLSAILKQCCKL